MDSSSSKLTCFSISGRYEACRAIGRAWMGVPNHPAQGHEYLMLPSLTSPDLSINTSGNAAITHSTWHHYMGDRSHPQPPDTPHLLLPSPLASSSIPHRVPLSPPLTPMPLEIGIEGFQNIPWQANLIGTRSCPKACCIKTLLTCFQR